MRTFDLFDLFDLFVYLLSPPSPFDYSFYFTVLVVFCYLPFRASIEWASARLASPLHLHFLFLLFDSTLWLFFIIVLLLYYFAPFIRFARALWGYASMRPVSPSCSLFNLFCFVFNFVGVIFIIFPILFSVIKNSQIKIPSRFAQAPQEWASARPASPSCSLQLVAPSTHR